MTSPSDGSPEHPDQPGRRPPKRGEPWPKRFIFTPDGRMRFEKEQPARPPRRFDDRRPYPPRPGVPAREGPGSGRPGSGRPPFPRHPDERQFPGNKRPFFRREDGRPPGPRPFREPGPPRDRRWEPRDSRPPGRPREERPSREFPPDAFRGPRPKWERGSPRRDVDSRPPTRGPRPPFERPRDSGAPRVRDAAAGRRGPRFDRSDGRRLPPPQSGAEDRGEPRGTVDSAPATRMELAVRILEKATPTIPADLLLRQTLARRKNLSRADSAWISRAVFSFFRWRGWLDRTQPVETQIDDALARADDFGMSPGSVAEDELIRAVPEWAAGNLEVTSAWLRSLQAEPMLWLRARTGLAGDVSAKLGNCEAAPWAALNHALRYDGQEDLFRNELFQAGGFEIQDLASQAVGIVCAPQPGETWWDACAGEGGKTLHLSDLMGGKGLVWASDRAEWRLRRLKQRAGRAGCFNYRSVLWNGGPKPPTRTIFDGVLLDAPCSGVGTWGRNPHARWTTRAEDVVELAAVQKELLNQVAGSVRPGGRLIYAVCTLTRAETSEVADAFAAAHPEFEPLAFAHPFAPAAAATDRLLLWPQDTTGNGMFIAAWQRRIDHGEGAHL